MVIVYSISQSHVKQQQLGRHHAKRCKVVDLDLLDHLLENYGRAMYSANHSLHDFTETINAVVARNRRLRKLLTLSWDVVDSWHWAEPSTPRVAMPRVVLDALVSVALIGSHRV